MLLCFPRCLATVIVLISTGMFAQIAPGYTTSAAVTGPKDVFQLSSRPQIVFDEQRGFLEPGTDPQNRLGISLLKHLVSDQQQLWRDATTPSRFDSKSVLPAAAFTGLLIASDSWLAKQVPDQELQTSRRVSDYSTFALLGGAGSAFLLGHMKHNDHLSETGLLSGEAALNSLAVTYLLKGVTQRPRPLESDRNGSFFGGGESFPSEHAALAWSIASVVAHEYPGPLTKIFAYGLASSVTIGRVTSKQHFASDALVGSALGWYFGRQVYRAHHDNNLGGATWGSWFSERAEQHRPKSPASTYAPLDSWIYPAFERMAALGYLKSAFFGLRPWTRIECARLLEEARESHPESETESDEGARLVRQLSAEFAEERLQLEQGNNIQIGVDSVYSRATSISGTPLRDSFHFGQTLVNDYGRPFGQGLNTNSGISAHALLGPLALSVTAEYQQAASLPLYSSGALQAISRTDGTPLSSNSTLSTSRVEILESMVALRTGNVELSFGKQSASLGPSRAGSLLLSNNAEPFTMLRVDSVSPFTVPLVSRILGPLKTEFFIGQLSGQRWVFDGTRLIGPNLNPQPYLHGEKISFRPTPNLEIGMGVTAMFSGPGLPFTWSNFLRTYYSHKANLADNPGKRFSAFDFSYRVPGLRRWLTVYSDSLVVDEISPIGSTRPSLNLGLYLPQLPKLPKVELRVEGLKTTHPDAFVQSPGFVYTDRRYRSGYTNEGDILGSWIGRAGIGTQAWVTYHPSARNSVEVSYRHVEVDRAFLEGGRLNDFSISGNYMLRPNVALSTFLQYEAWRFPVLSGAGQVNFTASFQLVYSPKWRLHVR